MILVNNVSKLVSGHVLDCKKESVEAALQFYDKLLYLKWNPKKLQGNGVWELRRRPEHKAIKEVISYEGVNYAVLGYKEYDWVHHVKDFAYINYSILEWVQGADSFKNEYAHRNGLLGKVIEENADKTKEIEEASFAQEQDYIARQTKGEWRKVMEDLNSGKSLARSLASRGF